MTSPRCLVLFNYDWDELGFSRWATDFPTDSAGFDLFSFPSNVHLVNFNLQRFVDRLARQGGAGRLAGRHLEPRTVRCAGRSHAGRAHGLAGNAGAVPCSPVSTSFTPGSVLETVAPEANTPFALLSSHYGEPVPHDLTYPIFVKPIKAAFSVLARVVHNRDELAELTRFSVWELWIIRHLVEPFERIVRARLPEAGSAHRMLLEEPVNALQYNLDGYVFAGEVRPLGIVESVMYPGTQAFMRFGYPCQLAEAGRARALDVARRFLQPWVLPTACSTWNSFYDAATDRLTVIEFNPRMASQFSDLYLRVDGIDLHRVGLELAFGRDPALLPRAAASAGAAASFVYRSFDPGPARHARCRPASAVGATVSRCHAVPLCQERRPRSPVISNGWAVTVMASCTWAVTMRRLASALRKGQRIARLADASHPARYRQPPVSPYPTPAFSLETSR
jgi:hypothetical protein